MSDPRNFKHPELATMTGKQRVVIFVKTRWTGDYEDCEVNTREYRGGKLVQQHVCRWTDFHECMGYVGDLVVAYSENESCAFDLRLKQGREAYGRMDAAQFLVAA